MLDRSYHHYALSGWTLLATRESEVNSFNIKDCSQAMPMQTPSLSNAPTAISTASPSMSPTASMAPSTPSPTPPGNCHWIGVVVVYDDKPSETRWYLSRLDDNDEWLELIKEHYASDGDTSHVESFCLQEGRYWFGINDWGYDGICCEHGEGHYNVTTSDGALIVEGGEWTGEWEGTYFSIPFVPGTSRTESY